MSAYIGVSVSVSLSNDTTVSGTIVAVDAQRNLLFVQPPGSNRTVTLNRNNIKAITTLDAAAASSSTSASAPQAPDTNALPTPSSASKNTGSRAPKRNNNNKSKAAKAAAAATATAPTPPTLAPEPMPDFDFEGALKGFDKARIWDEIRAHDHIDPAMRLVAHNRASSPRFNGSDYASSDKQRKLRPDENVLSPSPPPTQPVEEVVPPAPSQGIPRTGPSSAQDDGLERQLRIVQRKLAILESISGISVRDTRVDEASSSLDLECAIASPPPAPGAPPISPDSQHALLFALSTTLDESDAKLRFRPAASNEPSAPLPEKYRREMGLRMDNGSARVFLERVRAATFA